MSIELSVIMPSLNVADYIEECINSVLNQTLKDIEILCVDAGSKDGTWEILKKYETAADRTVKLVRSNVKSYGYQVNLGIKLAQGKYIAILETDDAADCGMYEYLLQIAKGYDLDFVKADYDRFYTLRDGERYYERVSLWKGDFNRYNRVFEPSSDDYLYAYDYNIWAGLYKKKFLVENDIWLNETKGAAFQDIGFSQQVLACAKKAYYSDKSFYRYRRDREESSINSVHGLQYARQEFSRLISDKKIHRKLICEQGLYWRMASSFMGEYRKTLISIGYNVDSKYIKDDYEWFCEALVKAVEQSKLDLNKLPDRFREKLLLILGDCKKYAEEICYREKKNKEVMDNLLDKIGSNEVVVFGAGSRGDAVVRKLLLRGVKPIFIYDNNEAIWGQKRYNIIIRKPTKPEDNVSVVIANKRSMIEIAQQLMDMGVPKEQIVFCTF